MLSLGFLFAISLAGYALGWHLVISFINAPQAICMMTQTQRD